MTRRGMTLVETLAVIPMMAAVAALFTSLFAPLVREVPKLQRTVQVSQGIQHMLRYLRRDIDSAVGLPRQVGELSAGDSLLLVRLPDRTVCYRVEQERVVCTNVGADGREAARPRNDWSLPKARISFSLWPADGPAYAVEVRSAVACATQGHTYDKLANSHVFFLGTLGGQGGRP